MVQASCVQTAVTATAVPVPVRDTRTSLPDALTSAEAPTVASGEVPSIATAMAPLATDALITDNGGALPPPEGEVGLPPPHDCRTVPMAASDAIWHACTQNPRRDCPTW